MIPVFVINLDESADRLAFMTRQLQTLNIPFLRIAAFGPDRVAADPLFASTSTSTREWQPGQVGCIRSHMHVWNELVAEKCRYALILEDDVHLSSHLTQVIENTRWIPGDAGIVRLETTRQSIKLGKSQQTISTGSVRELRSEAWGTAAYIIDLKTATLLSGTLDGLLLPVDYFLFNRRISPRARLFKTYQVTPALAIQDKFIDTSSAGPRFSSMIETGYTQSFLSTPAVRLLKQCARVFRSRELVNYLG